MTSKELRKLNRQELLEMLLQVEKENEALRAEVDDWREKANARKIEILDSGTMAEAALRLNEVFAAADAACAQYRENMQNCDAVCAQKVQAAEREAEEIRSRAQQDAERLTASAKKGAECYWTEASAKLEKFYEDHAGLRELLMIDTRGGQV